MKTLRSSDTERKIGVNKTAIHTSSKNATSGSNVKYRCPMKCCGEEVYDEPRLCQDSKMQMIPVEAGYIFY